MNHDIMIAALTREGGKEGRKLRKIPERGSTHVHPPTYTQEQLRRCFADAASPRLLKLTSTVVLRQLLASWG
jgi:hypothetical protein